MFDRLIGKLDGVAATLHFTGSYLWGVLVRKMWWDGLQNVIFAISFQLLLIAALRYVWQETEDLVGYEVPTRITVRSLSLGVFILGTCMAGWGGFLGGLNMMINPEYYAFEHLLEVGRGNK